MASSFSIGFTIIWCGIILSPALCWQDPQDVEQLDGYDTPLYRSTGDKEVYPKEHGLIQALRNRRAVTYRIKSGPSAYAHEIDDMVVPRDIPSNLFFKRDLSALTNMDVSAQYMEQLAVSRSNPRNRREVIEEEGGKGSNKLADSIAITEAPKEWYPQPSSNDDAGMSPPSQVKGTDASMLQANAEALLDRQNGREARGATKDQWVKLPYLARPLENEQLSTSQSNLDDTNHRMPRVNFVTQSKGLQTSESRNHRESLPRGAYRSDLRTDIYPPAREGRSRSLDYASYSRQSYGYPDDYNYRPRGYYDDIGYYDDYYYNQRRDAYPDRYDYRSGRRYDDYRYRTPYDKYDDGYYDRYDYGTKPRRIIYYATLPDVVRSPPNVYRYSNPNNRYDDDRYYRDTRYDGPRSGYYPSNRYPYSPLKKSENEGPRDLSASSTATKEKAAENLKRQQDLNKKANEQAARARDGNLNSHQYPINLGTSMSVNDNSKTPHQTLYHDITRMDSDLHRYDHPSFQAAVDDPYVSRHD